MEFSERDVFVPSGGNSNSLGSFYAARNNTGLWCIVNGEIIDVSLEMSGFCKIRHCFSQRWRAACGFQGARGLWSRFPSTTSSWSSISSVSCIW